MSITFKELLSGHLITEVSIEHQHNLEDLLIRMNKVRGIRGEPMMVTSGYRSMQDHLRIYNQMGITDRAKIPMKSNHLSGRAVDISDPNGKLMDWCEANPKLLEDFGLWCEQRDDKKRVHFQSVAYGSYKPGGSRFFKP
jgi:hypothetical protein